MACYSFLVGLFHPRLHAGLSRRTLPAGRGPVSSIVPRTKFSPPSGRLLREDYLHRSFWFCIPAERSAHPPVGVLDGSRRSPRGQGGTMIVM